MKRQDTLDLELAIFHFLIRPRGFLLLPTHTKGASLRGGFGQAFRRVTCPLGGSDCHQSQCRQPHSCLYGRIFETPRPLDAPVLRGQSHIPHPFVLEPPLTLQRRFGPQDSLDFRLILIGPAIEYLPYFLFAFEELGRRGLGHPQARAPFNLEAVHLVKPQGEEPIFSGHERRIRYSGERLRAAKLMQLASAGQGCERLEVEFLTPARLKYQGEPTQRLSFRVLLSVLLGRLSTLCAFYGSHPLELDFKGLLAQSERVQVERDELKYVYYAKRSGRGRGRMPLGGLIGRIRFGAAPEELASFLPFLRLGQYLHVGGGTAFGQGQYRLHEPSGQAQEPTHTEPSLS